jgi:hypothetical protein
MIAAHDRKQAARVGKFALFDVLHPGAIDPDRHVVLGFAGDGTGMAADAFAIIDDEPEVHSFLAHVELDGDKI